MRVLIIEDNAFNAYCLRRLLESTNKSINVTIATTSQTALAQVQTNKPDLVIIDGELTSPEGISTNGPALAQLLLSKFPKLPIIAWSDSEPMQEGFAKVFAQHHLVCNEYTMWPKAIDAERIDNTLMYYFGDSITRYGARAQHVAINSRC